MSNTLAGDLALALEAADRRITYLETDNQRLRLVLRRLQAHFQALNDSRGYASEVVREALKGEKDGQEIVERLPNAN
jgi:hypothetical protein